MGPNDGHAVHFCGFQKVVASGLRVVLIRKYVEPLRASPRRLEIRPVAHEVSCVVLPLLSLCHPLEQVMDPPQSNKQPVETQSSKSSIGKAKRHKIGYRNGGAGGSRVQVTSKPNGQMRCRRGHLKRMTEIPMDILYEIFSFLGPIDLLHLSWTSTLLCSTIMNDSARFLWTNVRV